MSRLAEFRALERLLTAKKSELSFIKINPRLQRELEFERKLHDLLAEYQFDLSHILAIRESEENPTQYLGASTAPLPRFRSRQGKHYRNPYTGEVVEAKSASHKTLQSWIEQYGRTKVESWATEWF
ncbi:transcriptional regulator [Pseudomonas sp. AFG_SD02_1510_Pfu_092]|uniref:histone-like nucleoid-structuring protein, MvaT/MvaU family n=1 Tax=Pseudomonas sp. AFG_SD02_1510_Pfu_092 TaxID=2259497 RepID=UPI000DEF80B1|nr:histone-like nucleoid-structuring protein, MvaT/MvaU family [Pseudomonas sp. AFG_SD02_1510_Pfu_092]RCL21036.1 transcriptional regulator [Pseudomonas sp. AFG_SD02_1510_Pfu_092]